jgi:hypothetical protein
LSFSPDPTTPANSAAVSGGAQAIRNVTGWLLQLFGYSGTVAETFANNPFGIDASNLVTVQANPVSSLGIATKQYVDSATAPNGTLVFSSGSAWNCTLSPAIASYVARAQYTVNWPSASVGNDTINFNGLGGLIVKKNYNGTLINLAANDIPAGSNVDILNSGDGSTCQIVMGPVPASSAGGGTAGGYASTTITSTTVSKTGFSNLTGTLALTAPATGGPFRLVVAYFVFLQNSGFSSGSTSFTVETRVTDGTNDWAYNSSLVWVTTFSADSGGMFASEVSPATYANGATPTINVQAATNAAQTSGSTVSAGGNSVVTSSPSYIKGWFIPSS